MTVKEQLKKIFKFDFQQLPRMTQLYYFSVILSPWLKKILKFNFLKLPRLAQFYYFSCHSHSFTMVEENFKIQFSERLETTFWNAQFYYFSVIVTLSRWLKKILKFDFLKRPTMIQFYYLSDIVILSPWLKKFFKFHFLKHPQNDAILPLFWLTDLADEVCTWRTRRALILYLREISSVHLHLEFFQVRTEDLPRKCYTFQTWAEVLDALGKRPNGVQGRSPVIFLDFGHSNRLETAFLATKYDTYRPRKGNC